MKNLIPKKQRTEINNLLVRLGYHVKPSFLIVGAQKAGTTALSSYIRQHPEVAGPRRKELRYFNDDSIYGELNHYFYYSKLPLPHQVKKNQKVFEATPEYLYHPEAAQRIIEFNPDMKIIILLRNPIERAFSAWKMYHNFNSSKNHFRLVDKRSFWDAVQNELKFPESVNYYRDPFAYIVRGIYYPQVKTYMDCFDSKNLMIVESSQFKTNRESIMKEICQFLSISDAYEFDYSANSNVSRSEGKLSDEHRLQLKDFYEPYNEQLFDLIGNRFNWN